jgi:nucleotide-binding universal stress UspA family protein
MEVSVSAPSSLIKTVIYATDFSDRARRAGGYASLLAKQFNADLLVTHAFMLSSAAMEVEAEDAPHKKSAQRADLEAALAAETKRFGEGSGNATSILLEGDPREAVPRLAQQKPQSLIVVGTQGRGRMERGIVGSTAERILRATDGPCLTVGPLVSADDTNHPSFRRILYATGLSPVAARGAPYAVAMAKAFNASLDVLHVVRPDDRADPKRFSEIEKEFRATLQEMVPQHTDAILQPNGVVEVGTAHEQILDYLRTSAVDLLVLSIRRSSHLRLQSRLSGAFNIIANALCPVMTLTG